MTKIQKTRIWPLRVIGNLFGGFANNHLFKALYHDDHDDHGFAYKYHGFLWKVLNKPYRWWGTYYELDVEAMKKDLEGSNWDDFDEDGIPYWEKGDFK